MNAIVCTNYGPPDVPQLKEVEKPTSKTILLGPWMSKNGGYND